MPQFQVTFNSNPNQEERMIKVESRKGRKDQEMGGGKRKQAQGKRHLKKQRERWKRCTIAVHWRVPGRNNTRSLSRISIKHIQLSGSSSCKIDQLPNNFCLGLLDSSVLKAQTGGPQANLSTWGAKTKTPRKQYFQGCHTFINSSQKAKSLHRSLTITHRPVFLSISTNFEWWS